MKARHSLPTAAERDARVLQLYEQLREIEQRLIPTGLHVFGRPSESAERADLLRMIASFDRPEAGTRSLTDLVAEGLGIYSPVKTIDQELSPEICLAERERVAAVVTAALRLFLESGGEAAILFLEKKANVRADASQQVFALLSTVSENLETNTEIPALLRALRGEYVEPGPGADIIQNPGILPTGRNTHAVNPYSAPSTIAVRRAEPIANALLERHCKEAGSYPETIAMVLWGIDNIKTEGEAVAQALWLLGVT